MFYPPPCDKKVTTMLIGSPITKDATYTTSLDPAAAHDQVLTALTGNGYKRIDDQGATIHADHGSKATFRLGAVSGWVGDVADFSGSDNYPISIDVTFAPRGSGTEVHVHAESYKPPNLITVPKRGPMAKRWRAACDAACDTVASALDAPDGSTA
jgi:hypothetical protein